MQRRGVRVSVLSTISTQPPMVADELRRQADEFVDLVHLFPKIGRDPAERCERPPRQSGSMASAPSGCVRRASVSNAATAFGRRRPMTAAVES
jgi:hypothetical protein